MANALSYILSAVSDWYKFSVSEPGGLIVSKKKLAGMKYSSACMQFVLTVKISDIATYV